MRGFSGISGNMGWRGSLLDAQLSDLLSAWDNFLAGDFWDEHKNKVSILRTRGHSTLLRTHIVAAVKSNTATYISIYIVVKQSENNHNNWSRTDTPP